MLDEGKFDIGLMAQGLHQLVPEAVTKACIESQQSDIATLESENAEMQDVKT